MLNKTVNMIYPGRCAVCDGALKPGEQGACAACLEKAVYINEPFCFKCGRPLKREGEYCDDCTESRHYFEGGRIAFSYGFIAESVYRFKYLNRPEYAGFYARELVKRHGEFIKAVSPDALIPVPLHRKRLALRGYNQASLIAHEISKMTGVPVYEDLLKRVKNTIPQKKFNKKQRLINVKKAFIVSKNSVKLCKVVVVDDIFTTGSTIDSLSWELKKAGVKDIYFITLTAAGT